jgi:opacity protein-like surface antigen
MKKWHFMLIGALSCFSTLTSAMPFTGIYMGIHAGGMQTELRHDQITDLGFLEVFNFIFENNHKATTLGGTGGFSLGYASIVMNNFMVGLEGRFNINNIKTNTLLSFGTEDRIVSTFLHSAVNFKKDFNLLLKFGSILDCHTLFYGYIGPQWGKFQIFAGTNFNQASGESGLVKNEVHATSSHYRSGFCYGIGIEHVLWEQLTFALEVNHIDYSTLRFPSKLKGDFSAPDAAFPFIEIASFNTLRFKTTTALLKMTHYFC